MTAQDRPQAVRHTVLFKTGSVIMEVFFLKKKHDTQYNRTFIRLSILK